MSRLTHLDEHGAARMVDVSGKETTEREATAEAVIVLSEEAFAAVTQGDAPKGDVFSAARLAGIMAAKKTPDLIPLCHTLTLSKAEIEFEMLEERRAIRIIASAKTVARTGVEMEALTAAAVAALTIYDMTKAIDKDAIIEGVRLLAKSGGKTGSFAAPPPIRTVRKPATPVRGRPGVLMGEATGPALPNTDKRREAFRAFMASHGLRATAWARQAGVPAAQIYAYLTGRARTIPEDTLKKLARAANVRPEDMFQ